MTDRFIILPHDWDPSGENHYEDPPNPKDPAYVTRMIADRLDGEDDPDWGLFFYAADFKTGVDVTVLTEDNEGREVPLAKYRLTITPLEDDK